MVVKVGIDAIAFYTPRYAFDLEELAKARGIDADKYTVGLGQLMMSVPPPGEDIVTMGANAAQRVLTDIDITSIEMLLFATESSIDQSKAAGLYLHELLQLPHTCRTVELKQACYAATFGLQLALPFLRENPDKKVLLVASDVARYGLNTTGESSQGAGAVALILSANPRILELSTESGYVTENVMDFWRPNYRHEALVDGKYSSKIYLTMLEKCWRAYQKKSGRNLADHDYFCYHTPVPRLVEKAHLHLLKINDAQHLLQAERVTHIDAALIYGRKIGNTYTASLYIALASLLDEVEQDLANKRIGFYSYGSGCVAEFFSGTVVPHYKAHLHSSYHRHLLQTRKLLSVSEYEHFYQFQYVEDGSIQTISSYQRGNFELSQLEGHKRIYKPVSLIDEPDFPTILSSSSKDDGHVTLQESTCVIAPGKLILSGEHAVLYGSPALAMAVNRYVRATVSRDQTPPQLPQFLLDLSDLAHHSQLNFQTLRHLKERVKNKYRRFVQGDFSIREVLQKPFELAQFALSLFADALNLNLTHGVKIKLQSELPIGCGMGSSAATIVSVMQAVSTYLNSPLTQEGIFKLALEAENMQHGRSSGLDLQVAFNGGCLYLQDEHIQKRFVPKLPMFLVNTGTPLTSTGQCVEKVAPLFKSQDLRQEFTAITKNMDIALQNQSWSQFCDAVHANHQLLNRIGVVPNQVQHFIEEINQFGAVAKICGAGAVAGHAGGAVLLTHLNAEEVGVRNLITQTASRYHYEITPITGEMRGVHAA
ncbi:MAG: hydroxymethylglutaryl-CoA synthase [Gammaproteobacteria bacterium]|nr:hydroxymethylglutaryl-CoA synthase [Gammaproteobacteria bacterium]